MALAEVLRALEPHGLKQAGPNWMAKCPAHEDAKASLSVSRGEKGAVLHCHAGCITEDIVTELGLTMSDLFHEKGPDAKPRIVSQYDYRDEKGDLLYQVCRFEPKDFRQRRPAPEGGWVWNLQGVRRVPYRLPEILATPVEVTVWIAEGEKDVDALAKLGLVATTNVGGAGKWRPEHSAFLKGRTVVILPDNDKPGEDHAVHVSRSLTEAGAKPRIVKLPGIPAKGDVSDWLRAGGTVEQLRELSVGKGDPAAAMPRMFRASHERITGERGERLEMAPKMLSFGVRFLDEALGGITPKDLIILGAKTGIGKTALATILALHNCQRRKRVHYFALEAEDREIERRMKFQLIAEEYYRTANGFHRAPIRYLDWYTGRLERELGGYEDWADAALKEATAGLHTFYRIDSFTSDDFCKQIEEIRDETDLIILDHLHYVDTDDENENRGYKKTVKQIRDSAIKAGKPVVVVAHVRKGDRRYEPLIPTVEDFHGSSDIPKIATKAVMLAAAYDIPNPRPYLWNTYMQISKCRLDNSVTRYAAVVLFNSRQNTYDDDYALGRLTDGGKSFTHLTGSEMPPWVSRRIDDSRQDVDS